MKITCVHCSAKYNLADEKAAGRSFKVRCKKCGEPIVVRAASEPAPAPMTGARQETSALFTLSQLSEIARQETAQKKPVEKPAEGSGLIDIRALATNMSSSTAPVAKPKEDLFVSFAASPMAAPILIASPPPKKSNAPALALASVAVAAIAIAAATVVAVTFGGNSDAMADARPTAQPLVDRIPEPVIVTRPEVTQPEVTQPEITQPEVRQPIATTHRPRRPDPIERPETPPVVQQEESLEQMVDILAPQQRRRPEAVEALPATPSRGDVSSALGSVASAVRACGQGTRGMATTRIVFSGDTGRVSDATVTSTSLPPDVRSCVARAARGARVPRFEQRTFSVNYPFSL